MTLSKRFVFCNKIEAYSILIQTVWTILTHCGLNPLVLDCSFALAGTQATLQPFDLLRNSLSIGAH